MTRCNILIKFGNTEIWFYRHNDGYPSATGADILAKLERADKKYNHENPDFSTYSVEALLQQFLVDDRYHVADTITADIRCFYGIRFSDSLNQYRRIRMAFVPLLDGKDEEPEIQKAMYTRPSTFSYEVDCAVEERTRIAGVRERCKGFPGLADSLIKAGPTP